MSSGAVNILEASLTLVNSHGQILFGGRWGNMFYIVVLNCWKIYKNSPSQQIYAPAVSPSSLAERLFFFCFGNTVFILRKKFTRPTNIFTSLSLKICFLGKTFFIKRVNCCKIFKKNQHPHPQQIYKQAVSPSLANINILFLVLETGFHTEENLL